MKTFNRIVDRICGAMAYVSYLCIGLMIAVTVLDVLLRKVTGRGMTGCYEVMQICMCLATFAAFAYTQKENGHIQVTVVLRLLPNRVRFVILTAVNILGAVMATLLGIAIWRQAFKVMALKQISTTLELPMFPVYFACAVLMFLFCVTLYLTSIRSAYALVNRETAEEIQQTWV